MTAMAATATRRRPSGGEDELAVRLARSAAPLPRTVAYGAADGEG